MSDSHFTFIATTESDTDRLGAALAKTLPNGTAIALVGTLGAGKTRLVEAVATACGWPADQVNSPTFVLCQHYHGSRTIHHLDAYRLDDDDAFLELGVDEYFDSDALTFVEWGDRVLDCFPRERVVITLAITDDDRREFAIEAIGVPEFISELVAILQS